MRNLTDQELVCEAIRRLRGRRLKTKSYEGASAGRIIETLSPMMSPQEMSAAFRSLMRSNTMVVTGGMREHNPDAKLPKEQWTVNGVIDDLHPDIVLKKSDFYFSPAGSLLREARKNGRLVEPSQKTRYVWFYMRKCYVTEDGLPLSVQSLLKKPHLPKPGIPEMAN